MQQIAFYSPQSTTRITYILMFLTERLGVEFKHYQDQTLFNNWTGAKINYSNAALEGLTILPQGLLAEETIQQFDYATLQNDPFAWMFFQLSRYEEYITDERDKHGRFQAKSSYLYRTNQLKSPVVDVAIEELKKTLNKSYPFLNFTSYSYTTQLTIDIDQSYLYKHKSIKRFLGGTLRDAVNLKLLDVIDRKLSFFGLKRDPYDIYDDLKLRFKDRKHPPIFFFQIGDYGSWDKNLNFKNKGFQKVIQQVSNWTEVGLHPSYGSNQSIDILKKEHNRISALVQNKVVKARQHYIKLHLPSTYRNYVKVGIQHDYTMGFADDIGFRAGTSRSFLWYDLKKEEITNLRVHPFCVMDVTLKSYLNLSITEANAKIQELQKELREVNGNFCLICHNESLSNVPQWRDWREVFYTWINN